MSNTAELSSAIATAFDPASAGEGDTHARAGREPRRGPIQRSRPSREPVGEKGAGARSAYRRGLCRLPHGAVVRHRPGRHGPAVGRRVARKAVPRAHVRADRDSRRNLGRCLLHVRGHADVRRVAVAHGHEHSADDGAAFRGREGLEHALSRGPHEVHQPP